MMQSPLFNGVVIFNVMESQRAGLREAAERLSDSEIRSEDKQVAAKLVEQFALNVPVLNEEKRYVTKREIDITARMTGGYTAIRNLEPQED
jgi:hypothetical protein